MPAAAIENQLMTRQTYADLIIARVQPLVEQLRAEFHQPHRVQSCIVDDLLPATTAQGIFTAFPKQSEMMEKKSLREHKFVAAQMNRYSPVLEEVVFAFQDMRIVQLVEEITEINGMVPDEHLYAGGISLMGHEHFLNPHLDNSHDKDRGLYRVLNLLYYVTPGWARESGGNLELWDSGPKGEPREIPSKFNRLVLMVTHQKSWHSVNQVKARELPRCCVSNYYFSPVPVAEHEYFHVTSFRGRPEQPVRDVILQSDAALRMGLRKVFKKGIVENPHVYLKKEE